MSTTITAMMCSVCRTQVAIDAPMQWVCPNATAVDRHHVLHFTTTPSTESENQSSNPFLAFRKQLAVDAFGAAIGLSETVRIEIIDSNWSSSMRNCFLLHDPVPSDC